MAPLSRQCLIEGRAPSMLQWRHTRGQGRVPRCAGREGAPLGVCDDGRILLVLRHVEVDTNEHALAGDGDVLELELVEGH